jgi:hypothetical protein
MEREAIERVLSKANIGFELSDNRDGEWLIAKRGRIE